MSRLNLRREPSYWQAAVWSRTAARAAILDHCLRPCARRHDRMNGWHAMLTLLAKEARLEFRTRELLTATVVFSLIIIVFFSFAFDPTPAEARRYGPGLLWIAFFFATSLMVSPSFAREQINDTLDALRLAPISSFAILTAKMLANFLFLLISEAILVPAFALFFNVSLIGILGRLIFVLLLGS